MLTNYAVELYTEKKKIIKCIYIVGDEEKKQRLYCSRKNVGGGGGGWGLTCKGGMAGG